MIKKRLIIVGDSAFAQIAYEYFTHDSNYEVVAFSVEKEFIKIDKLFDLPIVPFEDLEKYYSVEEHEIFVAIVYSQLNRLRERLYGESKKKGYKLASYISTNAFIWRNVEIGEHCFIFEDNTLQPFVKIGNNVVLWSGNHIGHHSTIHDNCFISSHVVISGYCEIRRNTFLGVNSTIANGVTVEKDNWMGPGLTILKDTEENQLFHTESPAPSKVPSRKFFRIKEGV